jgi:hypothetical protein
MFIMAHFVNCVRIIAVRFEHHSIHISTAGLHKSQATLLCTVASNTCGFSVWNIINVDIPVARILMCHLRSCKIC